jgi:hypothetical protein
MMNCSQTLATYEHSASEQLYIRLISQQAQRGAACDIVRRHVERRFESHMSFRFDS